MNHPVLGFPHQRRIVILFFCILLVTAGLHLTSFREDLDGASLDTLMRVVRMVAPRPAVEDVVIVGIDENTEKSFPEPFALWHKHIGAALTAIARGNPKVIALDIVLPERSYDSLMPSLDGELIRGLVAAKRPNRLVAGVRLDSSGKPQEIDKMLLAALGNDTLALAYVTVDPDGTARRFQPLGRGSALPLLAERIAQKAGVTPQPGIIDFACGRPFSYLPMQDVIAWGQNTPGKLAQAFAGKIVLIGKTGPDEDPVHQPLSVASWLPQATSPPGAVLHAQIVRALQSGRMLDELPGPALAVLVTAATAVFLISGLGRLWAVAVLVAVGIVALAYFAYSAGIIVPPASPMIAVVLGATMRTILESFEQRRFRTTIERQFAGYVSQNLLESLLSGEVDARQPRKYSNLGFLFADIRGFTTLTEHQPAEEVISLLNRYYEAITPAIHQFDGTIDNFRGDGILAIFGAPRAADDAPRRAVLAAREIFARLETFNAQLAREGRTPFKIGIGLSSGDAVVGNIGTLSRYGYSAVGDAVNVAARLQSLCKSHGMKIIAAEAIVQASAGELPFVALGRVDLAGHSPVQAHGVLAA